MGGPVLGPRQRNVICHYRTLAPRWSRRHSFDLQQRLATAGTPIPAIFITAHDDPVTRERARSGVAYLRKPFREDALIAAIQQALEGRRA